MKLYLVQHGVAKDEREDPARGLSDRGMEESKLVAQFIAGKSAFEVESIFHSEKKRAKETAGIFSEYMSVRNGIQEVKHLCPGDDVNYWGNKLRDEEEDLMLVGCWRSK